MASSTNYSFALISLALYVTAVIYSVLGFFAFRQRIQGAATASHLAWMLFAMAWWLYSYGVEIHVPELADKLFWVNIEYPAIVAIPLFWLFFVLEYTGQSGLLTRRNKVLASIIPVLTVLLVWTNEYHGWMYAESHVESAGGLTLLVANYGWFFWAYIVYSYLMLGGGSIILLFNTFRAPPALYRIQAYLILLATISPWLGSFLYVAGLFPIRGLDITPFTFIPTGVIMTWAMVRYHLLDIIPPQQNVILQSLNDGVVLLDPQQRVLHLNRAAEEFLRVDAKQVVGQPALSVGGECISLILSLLAAESRLSEITLEQGGQMRQFEVRVSPNYFSERDRRASTPSHLVILHDITEMRQAQAALKTREAILRAVNYASELFLKSASWEKHIPSVLEQLGRAANVDRITIFWQHESEEHQHTLVSQRYGWAAGDVAGWGQNPGLQNYPWFEGGMKRWPELLLKGVSISGPVREFPASEQELLSSLGILSAAVVPIFAEEKFWGFITFDDCLRERAWSTTELEALRTAADLFGAALTRQRVEQRLLSRQKSQTILQEIIQLALSQDDVYEMGRALVDNLGILIGADQCFLSLWDEARQKCIPVAAYGLDEELYRSLEVLPDEPNLTASALKAGQMLVVEDAMASPHISPRRAGIFGARSLLSIPMISGGKKIGVVHLGFTQPHRFTEEEIILSEQAAHLATLALAKFQAMEEARRRAEEAETLRRAGAAISETLDLQEATTRILEQLAFVIPHDSATVQLLHNGELEIIGGEGWDNLSSVVGLRFPIPGDNPNSVVIQTRKPYLVDDTYAKYPAFRELSHAAHIRSWLGVPLIVRNELVGLLAIDSREVNHFDPDNVGLVSAFAGQVAVAIENARLFDETQRLAITDGLTGIYNYRHFLEIAQAEFERAVRYKRNLSLILFDIDHFKQVNDQYGHPVGDLVLIALTKLCQEKLRDADPLGRYGGEEFVSLVLEADSKAACQVAERLRKEVERMVVPTPKGDQHITISVGVAEYNENTPSLEALIARADQAMYVAKHKGRNRVCMGK